MSIHLKRVVSTLLPNSSTLNVVNEMTARQFPFVIMLKGNCHLIKNYNGINYFRKGRQTLSAVVLQPQLFMFYDMKLQS